MTEWSQSSKGIPPHTFNKVCDEQKIETVEVLLEHGADPFLEDKQGVDAVTKAALSNLEPREKLSLFKNFYTDKVKSNYLKQLDVLE